MFHRVLIAGLVVMTAGINAQADVHRNAEHQFEATFPGKSEQVTKDVPGGGKIIAGLSKDADRTYLLGVATDAETLDPEQVGEFAKAFVDGLMGNRKNASITKEEELRVSDNAPVGKSFLVKHDTGWVLAWATIENGKGYFMIVEGTSEESLQSDAAKNFQKSIKITGVK